MNLGPIHPSGGQNSPLLEYCHGLRSVLDHFVDLEAIVAVVQVEQERNSGIPQSVVETVQELSGCHRGLSGGLKMC